MASSLLIMQARLASSRLAQKALLPIYAGKPSLLYAMQGVYGVADAHVLACDVASFSSFEPIAQEAGFAIMAGDADDVLARFAHVAKEYKVDYVIRATADNLIVGQELVRLALDGAIDSDADYFCFEATAHGSGVEVIRRTVLLDAYANASSPFEREHVTPYIYGHPQRYKVIKPVVESRFFAPDLRSTLDTPEDYTRLVEFFTHRAFPSQTIIEEYIAWMRSNLYQMSL
ncbi:cytidylyltransferase domain-containing protein [Entomospira culicis]|uniref:Spore coat protein n=1 Tax=Entomospira culicis TaxID=2719989 RepID=A0A968GFT3_9SPIO|nr:spore coat protein [Entomospira culicis]NIZ19023.1 spore coat protein [Entomospira culicis]NIZ69238.1 spore coat protein [Entomospira culicis]WDI37822.1 spore coat protein [Entomospira culicis]WDI39450.1 spore coat protein [Entomospira culicis]